MPDHQFTFTIGASASRSIDASASQFIDASASPHAYSTKGSGPAAPGGGIIYPSTALSVAEFKRRLIDLLLVHPAYQSLESLYSIARDHGMPTASTQMWPSVEVVRALRSHFCVSGCIVRLQQTIDVDLPQLACVARAESPRKAVARKTGVDPSPVRGLVHFPVEQKRHLLDSLLNHADFQALDALYRLASHHGLPANSQLLSRADVLSAFQAHQCTVACKVLRQDTVKVGLDHLCSPFSVTDLSAPRVRKRKELDAAVQAQPNTKRRRADVDTTETDADRPGRISAWPQVLPWEVKKQIMSEFRDATSSQSLTRVECTFCGNRDSRDQTTFYAANELNVDKLLEVAARLQNLKRQNQIQALGSRQPDGGYAVCRFCRKYIRGSRKNQTAAFHRVPVCSYANGTWTGGRPAELTGLTLLEEQVIARARSPRCFLKLKGGPNGQRIVQGNAVFWVQEPRLLPAIMPPPLLTLTDEIAVILVRHDAAEISLEALKKSPLLVRRQRVLDALQWLRCNNPLYADVTIDYRNLAQYPESDPLCVPTVSQLANATSESEHAGYSGQDAAANACAFEDWNGAVPITTSALFDLDQTEETYAQRKKEAIAALRANKAPFLKMPAGGTPMSTYHSPDTYAMLWPTLFPYGVGTFEDPLLRDSTQGFRPISMRAHVNHLLRRADRSFATHPSFIFVMFNLLQRRMNSAAANLSVKRKWFSKVARLMEQFGTQDLDEYERRLKNDSRYKAATDAELAIAQMLNVVSLMPTTLPGSTADIRDMREEIRAISRVRGLPHIFLTLNPADAHNPLFSFLAGADINIDQFFDSKEASLQKEYASRCSRLAENPVAGAEFFNLFVSKFLEILLGTKRADKTGILGRVDAYYGCVEAQGRGSLHLHMFIWLEGGMNPDVLKKRVAKDTAWRQQLLAWLEDVIKLDFPVSTVQTVPQTETKNAVVASERRKPALCRPLDPKEPTFDAKWAQDLRDVLDCSNQEHDRTHNDTCFKHLPKCVRDLKDKDRDCRFHLPREECAESHFDEDGHLELKCGNGYMNGYNDIVVASCRCNMDIKYIGSGTAAMAMFIYVTNYIAKVSVESSVQVSAMNHAMAATERQRADAIEAMDRDEISRMFLLKTSNALLGRCELSGQQVATWLQGLPLAYKSESFEKVFWSPLLRHIAPSAFEDTRGKSSSDEQNATAVVDPVSSPEQDTENSAVDSNAAEEDCFGEAIDEPESDEDDDDNDEPQDDSVNIGESETVLRRNRFARGFALAEPTRISLVYDVAHRPEKMTDMCLWDMWCQYAKTANRKRKPSEESSLLDASADVESDEPPEELRFASKHPQVTTHHMRRRRRPIIPVLLGIAIPRRKVESSQEKYALVVRTLFGRLTRDVNDLLGLKGANAVVGFDEFLSGLNNENRRLLDNFQIIWESHDARDDMSAQRRKRVNELMKQVGSAHVSINADSACTADDPEFMLGQMMSSAACGPDTSESDVTQNAFSLAGLASTQSCGPAVAASTSATTAGFFQAGRPDVPHHLGSTVEVYDAARSRHALDVLEQQKAAVFAARQNKRAPAEQRAFLLQTSDENGVPRVTTIGAEAELLEQRLLKQGQGDALARRQEHHWQTVARVIVDKKTLNRKQALAFLIWVSRWAHRRLHNGKAQSMMLGGPGGAGKSHVFDALKMFYREMDCLDELIVTAPTGVSASGIGGSTTHTESSLCVKDQLFVGSTKNAQALRTKLEQRMVGKSAYIIDEVYFMSAELFSRWNRRCQMGMRDSSGELGGGLDCLFAGDQYQLPPPGGHLLCDQSLITTAGRDRHGHNAANQKARDEIQGAAYWLSVDSCIILDEVVRQKDARFIELLTRLRNGICTEDDKLWLDRRVLGEGDLADESLVDVRRWIEGGRGSPLISYLNATRDIHNWRCTQAFADATGQSLHAYYSWDSVPVKPKSRQRVALTGSNRVNAWNVSIKKASDLSGVLHLVPGMPVYLTDNIATELGLSNGSAGTLIDISYYTVSERRYVESVEVDVPLYNNPDSVDHPHRVVLPTVEASFPLKMVNGSTRDVYRRQAPIIPGFAFTTHNSQSRSLDVVTVDLASCTSTAMAYVQLSRAKDPNKLTILRPFAPEVIQRHAPQQIRQETLRLAALEAATLRAAQSELEWYRVSTGINLFEDGSGARGSL